MAGMDYKKLGLKAGVEIHQQLATRHKLFCNCSAAFQDKEPVFEIKRKLRPVSGELGDVDAAAAYEALKGKAFRYKVYVNESCAVELDEEPPHPLNREALEIALQVALMLNCEVPEEIEVMRKAVLDGSNTSGFQRTALVGLNGWIATSFGRVGITNVCLEEDACQIIEKKKERVVYGLNRLGIPLVEIGTSPDIQRPEQAREVAEKIGMILRSTGKVRRGIGTIRQDLNVSIRGGARCEVKGVQKLKLIPKIVELEAGRQSELVKKGKRVTRDVRRALPNGRTEFMRPLPGAARMYPETDIPPIEITARRLKDMRKHLPELLSDKLGELEELGLAPDLAENIAKEPWKLKLFQELSKLKNVKPAFLANILVSYVKVILKEHRGADPLRIKEQDLKEVFKALDSGRTSKGSVMDLLAGVALGKKLKIESKGEGLSDDDIKKMVRDIIRRNPQALKAGRPEQALMGLAMKEIRGKAPGKLVMEIILKELKKN